MIHLWLLISFVSRERNNLLDSRILIELLLVVYGSLNGIGKITLISYYFRYLVIPLFVHFTRGCCTNVPHTLSLVIR
uniref:Uncharacterized protein n=1 Tax=Lutzomyia longipalpis TaxID=7200 RepID=A0A7G3AZU2_LUTLO